MSHYYAQPIKMVRHRFTVWVDVPAISGDEWSQYPDYTAEEVGRRLRASVRELSFDRWGVEHRDTAAVSEGAV
mgnify:CR=1 FL=1